VGLDMWFREDCQRILASVLEVQRNSARSVTPLDVEAATAYQRGFVDALMAVAVAFGIRPPTPWRASAKVERSTTAEPTYGGSNGTGLR